MLKKQLNLQTIKCDNAENSFNAIFCIIFTSVFGMRLKL